MRNTRLNALVAKSKALFLILPVCFVDAAPINPEWVLIRWTGLVWWGIKRRPDAILVRLPCR